jgi:hypothetical protein
MRASWDVINLACDEKAASQQAKPIEDAITHTHVYRLCTQDLSGCRGAERIMFLDFQL